MSSKSKAVTMENLNPHVVKMKMAVLGPLVIRAREIENELQRGVVKLFTKVIKANLGDAHAMGQKPITFIRQVLSCVARPDLIDTTGCPGDVKQRAKELLAACSRSSIGAYTATTGVELIRRHVAGFILRRDQHLADPQHIVLTDGASRAVKSVLQILCSESGGKPTGVMVPVPQFPLYSATLEEYGLVEVDYYLDEDNNWALSTTELERALREGRSKANVRALVVINPGNPTGQVLTRKNIEEIIIFAHKHELLLLADEVYQENVYDEDSKFISFKKVLREMGHEYSNHQELVSFMSVSKGYVGECGVRGGWMELVNFDPKVQANLYKMMSTIICANTFGQIVVDCVARPPQPGEPSHELWVQEKTAILDSLKMRANMISDAFNSMKGFVCNQVKGALYAFPRLNLPPKAIEAATRAKQSADVFYAFKLLEETGICVIAGSGFGQRPGTYHFRTTILPQPALLKEMLDIFQTFHEKFTHEYS